MRIDQNADNTAWNTLQQGGQTCPTYCVQPCSDMLRFYDRLVWLGLCKLISKVTWIL